MSNFKIQCNKLDLFKDKYCILKDSFIFWQKNKHYCFDLKEGHEVWSGGSFKAFKGCNKGFGEDHGLWAQAGSEISNLHPLEKKIYKYNVDLRPFAFNNNIIFDSPGNGFDIDRGTEINLKQNICNELNININESLLRSYEGYLIFTERPANETNKLYKVNYQGEIIWKGLDEPTRFFHNENIIIEYTDDIIIGYDNSDLREKFQLDINLKFMSFFDGNLLFSKNTDENTREVFSYTSNGELSWARSFELPHRSNSDLYSSNSYPYLVSITGDGKGKYELVYVDNKGEDIFSETIRKPQHTRLLDNGKHLVFEGAKSFTLATYEL